MNFWKVLHPLLSQQENEDNHTANGAILHSVANSLTLAEQKVIADKPLESLETSTGAYLDYFGDWWGLPRHKGETDDHYRNRMIQYLLLPRSTKESIVNAIRYYLKDKNRYVDVFEPWTRVFKLDNSKLDGVDHMEGSYYRYGVIDVALDVPIDENIMKVIDAFRPVGVLVYTNYDPLMSKDSKITYLGEESADIRTLVDVELGNKYDISAIELGLDDYDYHKAIVSNTGSFTLDNSKLDSTDLLTNPSAENYKADNLLLGTAESAQHRKDGYKQQVDAKPTVKYSFRGFINPDIRARVMLNFLNSANVPINTVTSPEIKHNAGSFQDGFTQVDLSGVAPDKTAGVEIAVDNRSNITDNMVKKSHATFHSDGKNEFPVSFDLGSDLGNQEIVTKVEFTVKNLKNTGSLAIVDGQDTDNWDNLVPASVSAKPPKTSSNPRFILDDSKLDSNSELTRPNIDIKPVQPITEDGTYTYQLTTFKHTLKRGATANRIFVKTDLNADIDLKVKLAVNNPTEMDMNWSVYQDENGYYNDYEIKQFMLVDGDSPDLHWTLAPTEVETASPYYVDIVTNTNISLVEREMRNTKHYNKVGAKMHYAILHNRNIALATGIPVNKQNVDSIDKLYDLSIPIVAGKTYSVLMNYASDDGSNSKQIVVTVGDTDEVVLKTDLSTNGEIKTYSGTYTATDKAKDQFLKLKVENGTASDLFILNFKLGVD